MEEKNNKYELSFWFSSRLEEKEVEQKFEDLSKQLGKWNATVLFSQSPQLKPLAYPVQKEKNAYFGYMQFEIPQEGLAKLQEEWKLNKDIIRFMIVKMKAAEERTAGSVFHQPIFNSRRRKKEVAPEEPLAAGGDEKKETESKNISLEELDEKLNEILKQE